MTKIENFHLEQPQCVASSSPYSQKTLRKVYVFTTSLPRGFPIESLRFKMNRVHGQNFCDGGYNRLVST